jgi:adenylylsulfate kinase
VRKIVGAENYIEVFVATPLEICEQRDVKGLYKKARAGEVPNFTGISSPYENPEAADITIHTDQMSVEQSIVKLLNYIQPKLGLSLVSE